MNTRTREERLRIVREWRESGSTAYGFARAKGIALNSLKRWASAEAERPAFVRVEVAKATSATVAVQVGSARVVVEPGFDHALLRAVVEALS